MHRYITCISVISIIFVIAYSPAMQGGFIWDDDLYLINNITLQSWHGLLDIWFIPKNNPHYYPMLFSGFWLEYHMWGLEPLGYHINNILLHMAGTFVLWRVLRLLCIPGAGMVAAFFLLHPVHVESVAWITERKNVLSGFFIFLQCTCSYATTVSGKKTQYHAMVHC